MQTGRRVRVRAGSAVASPDPNAGLFSATLAQNAGLNGRVKLSEAIAAGRVGSCVIQGIQVVSFDALDWEFWFWRNSGFQNTGHPDLENFAGFWSFTTASGDGKRIAGTGLYYYYIDGLGIYYEDDDAGLKANIDNSVGAYLNVTLVNRSAGAKTVNGWFDVTFVLEPTQGQ